MSEIRRVLIHGWIVKELPNDRVRVHLEASGVDGFEFDTLRHNLVWPEDLSLKGKDMKEYANIIGMPATFEHLAAECAELAVASLDLARKIRNENPTPKTQMECLSAVTEEVADVLNIIDQLAGTIDMARVNAIRANKMVRWGHRLEER